MDLHNDFPKVRELLATWVLVHCYDEIVMVIWNSGSIERVTSVLPLLTTVTISD